MSDDSGHTKATTAPTVTSVSSAGPKPKEADFKALRLTHSGHDLQHLGWARVAPGVLGVPAKAVAGVIDIWFCGTDGQILYDLG